MKVITIEGIFIVLVALLYVDVCQAALPNPCFEDQTLLLSSASGTFGCAPNVLLFGLENAQFYINPPVGPIALSFSFFDMDYGADEIQIFFGETNIVPSVLQGEYTGNKLPATVFTTNPPSSLPNNQLLVQIQTDNFDYPSGFKAVYTSGNIDPCQTNQYFVFTDFSGTITCNGYANLLKSQWVIQPNRGVITVTISNLVTEEFFDVVIIRDGYTKFDKVLGTYFGEINTPVSVSTSGRVAFIEFNTNADTTKDGFSISWETAIDPCFEDQDIVLVSPTGTFGCPIGSDFSIISTWLIDTDMGKIYYKFSFLDLETDFDYLYVFDGPDDSFPLLARYTGNTLPPLTFSSGNSLLFRLTTDASVPSNGFQLQYTALEYDLCVHNDSVVLDQPAGFFGCSFTAAVRLKSSWLIKPNNGQIHVSFSKFKLEEGDYLKVYSGTTEQNQLLYTLTGDTLPVPFDSESSSTLLFVFTTNDLNPNLTEGFTAIYTSGETDPCKNSLNVQLTSVIGSFGCAATLPSVISTWTITPPTLQNILLNFTALDISPGDTLVIYDGGISNRILGVVSNNNLVTFQASGRSMTIQLITNEDSDSSSFEANFGSLIIDRGNPTAIVIPVSSFTRSPTFAPSFASESPINGLLGSSSRNSAAPSKYSTHPTPPPNPSQIVVTPPAPVSLTPSISKSTPPAPGPSVQPYRIGTPINVFANLHCIVNITQCCKDFVVNWANLSNKNAPILIDLTDCSSLARDDNLPNFTIKLNQFGSNFNNAMSIVKDYWDILGCTGNPIEQPLCIPDNIVTNTEWNKINLISMTDPFPIETNSYTTSTGISTESSISEITIIVIPDNGSPSLVISLFMLIIIAVFFN